MAREQPVVARDFLGLGIGMGEAVSGDVVMGKQNFLHVAERSPSINASPLCNNMALAAGMKHSAWSKATIQHFLSLRGSGDERYKEQIAENLPERLFAHFIHPLQMQDLTRKNEKNGLFTQGDSLTKSNSQVCEEYGSSVPISGGFQGSATRIMISPSKAEAMAAIGAPAASEMRLSPSGMTEMQYDAPLTIFYAGSVKVFNNISAEQAQAIMHLASAGHVQSIPVDPMAATVAVKSVNGTPTLCPQDNSVMNLPSNQMVLNQQANQPTTTMQLDIKNLNIPSPSSPGPSAPPLVPTALPHARKVSLARFLEKRRERAHSKCPYAGGREDSSAPEERLSSSNDPTCYTASSDGVGKRRGIIPAWMLESVGVKEQNITVI